MLQRQQAGAIIAARQRIVEGAVGMVEMALEMLSQQRHRRARRRAQGGDGQQPAGGALRRAQRRSRSSTPARSISRRAVAERKPFLLRIDRERARGRPALGRRRSAQPERADRVPAAARVEGGDGRERSEEKRRRDSASSGLRLFVFGLFGRGAGASRDEALRGDRTAADRERAARGQPGPFLIDDDRDRAAFDAFAEADAAAASEPRVRETLQHPEAIILQERLDLPLELPPSDAARHVARRWCRPVR